MKKFILLGVVALAFLSPVFSQIAGISTERLTRLDDFVLSEVAKGNIPGAVTLIIKDGQVVQHKALGFKDAVAKFKEEVKVEFLKLTKSCELLCVLIAPVTELIPKNTESKDEVVVLIEPVVELILKNTESNEDVVVFIEPVVELILKNTESNDEVVVLIEPVVELILKNTESKDEVVVLIEPVVELICLLTKSCELL